VQTRTLVISLLLFCLVVFAGAFVIYDRSQGTNPDFS